jgi:hypothetical protein
MEAVAQTLGELRRLFEEAFCNSLRTKRERSIHLSRQAGIARLAVASAKESAH